MDFTKAELKTLLGLALTSTAARPADLAALRQNKHFFRRVSEADHVLTHLAQCGFISVDRIGDRIHLLQSRLVEAMGLAASAPSHNLFQDERPLDEALAQVCAESAPERAESARLPCTPCTHLVSAEALHLPSGQVTAPKFSASPEGWLPELAEADGIVQLLEQRLGTDATRRQLWQDWAGWWAVVRRNNPERIVLAYEKARAYERNSGRPIRFPERYLRRQIAEMARGLG